VKGGIIPALRIALSVHGQPSELGERNKKFPQENLVSKIILQMHASKFRVNKPSSSSRTTSETIIFHKIKLHRQDKNHSLSHLPQV